MIVGGGPAGLAAAIRLKQLAAEQQREVSVCLLEKGSEVGAHILSGAVIDPRALNELLPDWKARGAPLDDAGDRGPLPDPHARTRRTACRTGLLPRLMNNHGNYIVSLGNVCRWLGAAGRSARRGDLSRASPPPRCCTTSNGAVRGVATGDMGVAKDGTHKPRLPARHGAAREVHAVRRRLPRLAVAGADAAASTCATASIRRSTASASRSCGRSRRDKHQKGLVAAQPGLAARLATPAAARSSITSATAWSPSGFVVHLNYENPHLSPYDEFQRFKTHPAIRADVRRRQAPRLRRARDQRRRPAVGAEARVSGRRADRLRGRLRQPAAHQGQRTTR